MTGNAATQWMETWEKTFKENILNETQYIDVRQKDEGGGPFFEIETEGWSFDYLEDMIDILEKAGVQRRPQEQGDKAA